MNPRNSLLALVCLGASSFLFGAAAPSTDVKLTSLADRVRVEIGGQHFTDYVFGDGASRPYLYPINATDGTALTRHSPMKDVPGEEFDHPWQRSMWFAHAVMNGVDFWNEGTGDIGRSPKDKGKSVHDSFVAVKSGPVGVLQTKTRYHHPDGTLICTDERTMRFHAGPDGRFIDFAITLQALPDKPLLMGDNKDGTMAVRVAQWMTMPHNGTIKGPDGKNVRQAVGGTGRIVTSTGFRDAEAWGKRAAWCDYNVDRDGKTYGIAIFDHPQNLRHPTWWMARGYGLFGANPFGWHDFEKEFANDAHKGDHTIPASGTLTLRYRFYFHTGDEKGAKLAERYAEFAAGK